MNEYLKRTLCDYRQYGVSQIDTEETEADKSMKKKAVAAGLSKEDADDEELRAEEEVRRS